MTDLDKGGKNIHLSGLIRQEYWTQREKWSQRDFFLDAFTLLSMLFFLRKTYKYIWPRIHFWVLLHDIANITHLCLILSPTSSPHISPTPILFLLPPPFTLFSLLSERDLYFQLNKHLSLVSHFSIWLIYKFNILSDQLNSLASFVEMFRGAKTRAPRSDRRSASDCRLNGIPTDGHSNL